MPWPHTGPARAAAAAAGDEGPAGRERGGRSGEACAPRTDRLRSDARWAARDCASSESARCARGPRDPPCSRRRGSEM